MEVIFLSFIFWEEKEAALSRVDQRRPGWREAGFLPWREEEKEGGKMEGKKTRKQESVRINKGLREGARGLNALENRVCDSEWKRLKVAKVGKGADGAVVVVGGSRRQTVMLQQEGRGTEEGGALTALLEM